jgi:hypothetical protein
MIEMTQTAPYPRPLAELVKQLAYKADWVFTLEDLDRGQGSQGLTLVIRITTPDAYHPDIRRTVLHYFPVPPAAYDVRSWRHWLLEQVLLVERHEACEFFRFEYDTPNRVGTEVLGTNHRADLPADPHVDRPYAPSHGPGNDPYLIRELGTDEDVRTSFRGELLP